MGLRINLNADVGEGMGNDDALLDIVGAANIACGGHAGDRQTMHRLAGLAAAKGVAVGAHPGFLDRASFGRREMHLTAAEVEALTRAQIDAMQKAASDAGARLAHVKAHGALYNMAARDRAYAEAIGRAIKSAGGGLIYVVQAASEMERAAERLGLAAAREAFPDRGYADDGQLAPRGTAGAEVGAAAAAERACRMVADGAVTAVGGRRIAIAADTLCIHGDRPDAIEIARSIRAALVAAGVSLVPLTATRV